MSIPKSYARLRDRVDEVLHYVWDPIGVSVHPAARDEYTTYALQVVGMLLRGASADAITRYLLDVEGRQMGMGRNEVRAWNVAYLLVAWREALHDGSEPDGSA